jgi:hypothetical protein
MRTVKILGALLAVGLVIAVGSMACGDDDGDSEVEQAFNDILVGSSISSDDFDKVEEGMLREEAEAITGPKVEGLIIAGGGDEPAGADCAYYFEKGDDTKAYRICYENDEVIEKIEFTAED